jgi:hypothetical protein
MPDGPKGEAYLLCENFRVIMRYNSRVLYGLAVCELARLIQERASMPYPTPPLCSSLWLHQRTRINPLAWSCMTPFSSVFRIFHVRTLHPLCSHVDATWGFSELVSNEAQAFEFVFFDCVRHGMLMTNQWLFWVSCLCIYQPRLVPINWFVLIPGPHEKHFLSVSECQGFRSSLCFRSILFLQTALATLLSTSVQREQKKGVRSIQETRKRWLRSCPWHESRPRVLKPTLGWFSVFWIPFDLVECMNGLDMVETNTQ